MKRGRVIAIKLVVFLLLGAVVNVAVAWGCAALLTTVQTGRVLNLSFSGERYEAYIFIEAGGVHTQCLRRDAVSEIGALRSDVQSLIFSNSLLKAHTYDHRTDWDLHTNATDSEPPLPYIRSWIEEHRPSEWSALEMHGWPALAMRWSAHAASLPRRSRLRPDQVRNGILSAALSEDYLPRALPLRPIWPGFLINTLFYALVLWLLWSTPFATRRLIRKRRGRCARCGYDLRHAEHDVCPECGA